MIGYESAWPPEPGLDIAQLMRTGVLEGPYRRSKPIKVSLWRRMVRALRAWQMNLRSPL